MPRQDFAATLTWTLDFTAHLAANSRAFTISSATATCVTSGVTVTGTAVTGAGTGVTFKVAQTGISTQTDVVVVVTATMSNGDVDVRAFPITFAST